MGDGPVFGEKLIIAPELEPFFAQLKSMSSAEPVTAQIAIEMLKACKMALEILASKAEEVLRLARVARHKLGNFIYAIQVKSLVIGFTIFVDHKRSLHDHGVITVVGISIHHFDDDPPPGGHQVRKKATEEFASRCGTLRANYANLHSGQRSNILNFGSQRRMLCAHDASSNEGALNTVCHHDRNMVFAIHSQPKPLAGLEAFDIQYLRPRARENWLRRYQPHSRLWAARKLNIPLKRSFAGKGDAVGISASFLIAREKLDQRLR